MFFDTWNVGSACRHHIFFGFICWCFFSPLNSVIFLRGGLTSSLFYLCVKISVVFIFKQVIYMSLHFYRVGLITHFVLFYHVFHKLSLHTQCVSLLGIHIHVVLQVLPSTKKKS